MLCSDKCNRVPVTNSLFILTILSSNESITVNFWLCTLVKIYPGLFTLIKYLTKYETLLESFLESAISLIQLLNTMVLPYLNYCCIVWHVNYFGRLEFLIKLQKMIRIIIGLKSKDHTSQFFE